MTTTRTARADDLDAEARADVLRGYRDALDLRSPYASRYAAMQSIALAWANSYMYGVNVGLPPDNPNQLANLARWRAAREYCTKIAQRLERRDTA